MPLPDGSGFRNEPAVSTYDAGAAGVDRDLRTRLGPVEPVLDRIDPGWPARCSCALDEFVDLLAFVRAGLLDSRARQGQLQGQSWGQRGSRN